MARRLGLTLLVAVVVVALAMIGRAAWQRSRMAENEAVAVASLQRINAAQAAYAAECGQGNFATSLMDLATPPPGRRDAYLSYKRGELGFTLTSEVSGYLFTIRPGRGTVAGAADCNEFATQTRYYALAVAMFQDRTGVRSFATNQDGVIWQAVGLPPPAEPFGPPATRPQLSLRQ